jgi:hypothetical protein
MGMRWIASVALAFIVAAGGAARAENVVEPSTGHSFDTTKSVDGKRYALLGVGVRKKFIIKVYSMALYAEEDEAKKSYKSAGGAEPTSFVAGGGFGKVAVLHFARDVDAGKIKSAYEEGLSEELSDRAPADVKQGAQAFVAAFDKDLKEGQEIVLRTAGKKIEINVAGAKKELATSPTLCKAIWNIWLGPKPISKDLKTGLVSRIDSLK